MTGGLLQIVASGTGAIGIDNQHPKDPAWTGDVARAPTLKV
jgi:hypothetical protein